MNTATTLRRSGRATASARLGAFVTAARPRQWPKNLLVFGAPAAAGLLFELSVLATGVLAFLAFTLAAAGTYLINDAVDAEVDRLHPVKRSRPVAAGIVTRAEAATIGGSLLAVSLLPAMLIGQVSFVAILLGYVALTVSYSLWLKQIVVVDIVAIALGFGLRAVAGAFAAGVVLSQWFLIVTFFGALFLVAGKRYGEQQRLGSGAAGHRPTQAAYATFYHQHVMTLSSGVTLTGYGLWAYQHGLPSQAWFLASFVFLVMVMLRFALLVHAGASDDPVEIVWNDGPIRVLVILWLVLAMAGIQLG